MRVGLLTSELGLPAFSSVRPQFRGRRDNGKRGAEPLDARLQRRDRSGFTPDSLFAGRRRPRRPATRTRSIRDHTAGTPALSNRHSDRAGVQSRSCRCRPGGRATCPIGVWVSPRSSPIHAPCNRPRSRTPLARATGLPLSELPDRPYLVLTTVPRLDRALDRRPAEWDAQPAHAWVVLTLGAVTGAGRDHVSSTEHRCGFGHCSRSPKTGPRVPLNLARLERAVGFVGRIRKKKGGALGRTTPAAKHCVCRSKAVEIDLRPGDLIWWVPQ